ncbi:NAD(+)/NADH kinase [Candidatus Peregrinibacteria bacterium]|nr:MAG: NAD(+)/NADH kinase [Candidatus Peregrinibacteria bacterium]
MKAKKPQKFQVIGLLGKNKIEEQAIYLKELKTYFDKRNCTLLWDDYCGPVLGKDHQSTRATILKKCDLVLSLGGDGTLLKLIRDLPLRKDLYVLAVNLGTLGFNTEVSEPTKVFPFLNEIFAGQYHSDERLLLRATLYRKGKKIATHLALNEAVINQGNFARLIGLYCEIDQRKMIEFKADGIIVATPTGSTGHSLSAGGPIIHPRIEGFVFTPICPAELSVRPIVIPSNRQLTIRVDTERRYADNKIGLTIDGQIMVPVEYGDVVKIRASHRRLRLIRAATKASGGGNYYKLLREKLRWGKRG